MIGLQPSSLRRVSHFSSRWSALLCAVALLLTSAAVPATAQGTSSGANLAARVQAQLDAGQPERALELLDQAGAKQVRASGELLLLRSTAYFLQGETAKGKKDLEAALEVDPNLRQGWLNRAALEMSEQRYEAALASLKQAERLDPRAEDNHLNIGAAHLLAGDLPAAADRFERYFSTAGGSAEAYFLVAKNYAAAGYVNLAVDHLKRAIGLDERSRVAARGEASFRSLIGEEAYDRLMAAEPLPPAADARTARTGFAAAYSGGEGKLLPAVLSALQLAGEPFDSRVELTPGWALIWGEEIRIIVRDAPPGSEADGMVELSAPGHRFSEAAWQQRSDDLFRRIQVRLLAES